MNNIKKDYFFCYSLEMSKYIRNVGNIDFITTAINPTTKKVFTLFRRSDELAKTIDEYKQSKC